LSAPKAQLGLPELQLGIIPGFGGEDSPQLQHNNTAKMSQLYASCKDAREESSCLKWSSIQIISRPGAVDFSSTVASILTVSFLSDAGTQRLPRLVGLAKAAEMMLVCQTHKL
jgi:enoyl-CoA hydratase/carnithine racemase